MNEIASLIGIAAAADNPAVLAVVLAVVIAVAALFIWKRMRGIEIGEVEPDSTMRGFDEYATEDDTQPEALAAASIPAPAVVYIAPAKTPALIVRMHERLASAYRAEDRAEVLRQQSRLVRAGYHPPLNLEDCMDALDAQIFTTIKDDVITQEQPA